MGGARSSLTDGVVLLVSDGMVREISSGAGMLLGDCVNRNAGTLLEHFLDPSADEIRAALARLEASGEPVDLLARGTDGRLYHLAGAPAGAMLRLTLREAEYLDTRLAEADQKAAEAEERVSRHDAASATLTGLVGTGPIICWQRTAAGEVTWADGEIKTRTGAVRADQAVDLIVARTRLNRQPAIAGQPQKSRIEIVLADGAEAIALHVIEVLAEDGNRLGFATDAGTAASAERTLTRFVQTMTETFAHLTVGLAIFDRNQTLALFNPALVQMWQVEPAWLARRPSLRDIVDELRAIRRLPEVSDFHAWRNRLTDLFDNTEAADYEELWHLADGSNIRVLARPHPHGSLAFIFDDVTERMRLEQRYRHSIDLRRATLDHLKEGVAVFGANGLLQFVNKAFHDLWGTNADQVYAAMHARQLLEICEARAGAPQTWHRLHGFISATDAREPWDDRLTMPDGEVLGLQVAALPDGSTMAVFADVSEEDEVAHALAERDMTLEMIESVRRAATVGPAATLRDGIGRIGDELRTLAAGGPEVAGLLGETEALAGALDELETLVGRPVVTLGPTRTEIDLNAAIGFCLRIRAARAAALGVRLVEGPLLPDGRVDWVGGGLQRLLYAVTEEAMARAGRGGTVVLGCRAGEAGLEIHARAEPGAAPLGGVRADPPQPMLRRLTERAGGAVAVAAEGAATVLTLSFPDLRAARGGEVEGATIHPIAPGQAART